MRNLGVWRDEFDSRIKAIEGDIQLPFLGLSKEEYESLAGEAGAVYHSAAEVNWVQSYDALRDTNVSGTKELLRFACRDRVKPFFFISSAAVCYSTSGPREVGEDDDVHPYLHGLHLGYAQSKSVAEALVCQAGDRGLPVAIFRPSLITGDRASGIVNADDLLSRLVKAAVVMGLAPDLDWNMDICPVDYVADAVVALTSNGAQQRFFHLASPSQRHWREFVLWMNLYGYSVKTAPYREWLDLMLKESRVPGHPLRELRPFFSNEPAGEGGLTLPELFEEPRRSRISSDQTLRALRDCSIGSPRVGAEVLDRYFQRYIESGFLPEASNGSRGGKMKARVALDRNLICKVLNDFLRRNKLELLDVEKEPMASEHSIISELTSWKYGSDAGLDRLRLVCSGNVGPPRSLTAVVKRKAHDEHAIEVAVQVAEQCSSQLGTAFSRHRRNIGLAGSHFREIGIYGQVDEKFQRHAPSLLGSHNDEERGECLMVLEDISHLEMLDSSHRADAWSREKIEAVILGLAALHSIWYGREKELRDQPWLGPVVSRKERMRMVDLWSALAEEASSRFSAWAGPEMASLQNRLVRADEQRWKRLGGMTRTLIHNDFNSRNIALRRNSGELRLCAYDWELATLGVPQHDLAEFLCFALPVGNDRNDVLHYLDFHRTELEKETSVDIDQQGWTAGFSLALHDLLVDRLGMYAMIDRFRPQRYLPRVVSTWKKLYNYFPMETV